MRAFAKVSRGRPKRVAANDNDKAGGQAGRDEGTAELQMKRALLARGLDPVAAAHPLDLLLAKDWIKAGEHRAGWRYAALYRRVVGRTDVSYGRFYDGIAGTGGGAESHLDEDDLAELTRRFRAAKQDLLQAGPRIASVTERVSVFGTWPSWVLAPAAGEECKSLRNGLQRLDASLAGRCR